MTLSGLLAVALASIVGLSLGLLGGGGSILAVPVLVYVARVGVHDAITMALGVVAVTSLVASLLHARRGQVDVRTAVLFALAGGIAAAAGALVTDFASDRVLRLLFAAVMLLVGGLMVRQRRGRAESAADERPGRLGAMVAAAAAVGFLTGFLGVGGGFLVVATLLLVGRLPARQAVGTSLVVITVNSTAGFLAHLPGSRLDWELATAFTAVAALGAFAGEMLSRRLPSARLRAFVGAAVLAVGAFMALDAWLGGIV